MMSLPLLIFAGFIALVLYVVHQATKKSPKFLKQEKVQMEEKVNTLKKDIITWNDGSLREITNDIEYSYVKSMSSVLTGVIKASDNLPSVAFQRIDRGIFVNSRILASSTDFKIYCEFKNEEKLFFFNDVYIGKIVNHFDILDAANNQIGKCNRISSQNQTSFIVTFRFGEVAEIWKNEDRKAFINKYRYHSKGHDHFRSTLEYREPQPPIKLIKSIRTTDEEELKWIISLTIFEATYYGFSFVS
ncbi:hypothetical protein OD917_20055 [Flavobacterium sp. SH_e]|uniref:hypothetical protein n=1 Tax=Flavobacterium TaxID=237 RepID=UPI0021E3E6CC|nr:hypothetical protein [Flavobacterium sp. SH_e]MCV2487238.1 hypothetical protein [Flavobacterium sp. SH_e]